MSYGAPPSNNNTPKIILAIVAGCGGCLLIAIISVVLLVNAGMNSTPVLMVKASSLMQEKRYSEAETLLLVAERKSPRDAMIQNELAWAYYLDGKYAEGEPHAVKATKIDPNPSHIDTLGHIYLGLKRYDDAEKQFKLGLKGKPNMGESHDGLGQIYEHRGKFDKALDEYNQAMDLDPSIAGLAERIERVKAHVKTKEKPKEKPRTRGDSADG